MTSGLLLLSLTSTAAPAYARQYHGHGGHAHVYSGFSYGGWYSPWSFYFAPYFGAYWYPYYQSPVFYPPYGWYGVMPDTASSVRVEVTPREAKVYVDGYFAGIVDDFDGTFQRLRVVAWQARDRAVPGGIPRAQADDVPVAELDLQDQGRADEAGTGRSAGAAADAAASAAAEGIRARPPSPMPFGEPPQKLRRRRST